MIPVKIRKLSPAARIPTYATSGSAAFDLYAAEDVIIAPGETKKVPLGFAVEIPVGFEMQIRPRSGNSYKTPLRITNSPATIDVDFRGEVAVLIDNTSRDTWSNAARRLDNTYDDDTRDKCEAGSYIIRQGDRIAQAVIVPVPRVEFVVTDEELTQTERGNGGFGSSGIN